MVKISLRDYQRDAVKFGDINKKNCLCLKTGTGKTLIAMFLLRYLLKTQQINKVIIACTKTSVSVFISEFLDKFNKKVKVYEKADKFLSFLGNEDEKIGIIKHSMFQTIGLSKVNIQELKIIKKQNDLKTLIIVDEAHKISNPTGNQHKGFQNMSFIYDRVCLATATPYSSSLLQLYGLVELVDPSIYKDDKDFENQHIDYFVQRDNRGKVLRKQIIRYKNLKKLRKNIEHCFFFYYPKTQLNYTEHIAKLSEEEMEEYTEICKGLLTIEKEINKK